LKILQISSAQSFGGGERHLADLVNGLVGRGHDVHVALRKNSPLISELKQLPAGNVITLPLRNSLDAMSARNLSQLVRKKQVQIVHAHMARDYSLAAYAARMNRGSKFIFTRHVLFDLNRLHRITLAKATRIIAVSQAVASQLRADAIVPSKKISIVLNRIDTKSFQVARRNFTRSQFLDAWNLPQDCLLVGTVGELTPIKGQEEFLRAAALVLKQIPIAYFIVAGIDHSQRQEHNSHIKQLIKELDLANRVRLVGWLDDLAQLYCALDVFVSASHTESFGLALAEAMAAGTAVVATETAGARELITSGETGLLVPVNDVDQLAATILGLLTNENERLRLATAAQQSAAERFSIERMIDETEKIYEQSLQ
jgi:glycosyltransferase involved in cell wall biosynthesis